ncbi:uncharacterized protein FSUBG_12941 [Fusarium subglutinans]|uniref:Uncharacterized protein n=1 Tax=Gibberella subglutinans TaxID=42677 RepID=A0A8H5L3D3_GIBSU|nr:uncharacterized protein FSUBG_12941 [Fusarium subglutinans]KAF5584027.1 hypothetical protein FSUBG_12941 [Fusarium subglutinans]
MLLAPGDGDDGGSSTMIDDEFMPAQTLDSNPGMTPLEHRAAAAQTPSAPCATATDEPTPSSSQTLDVAKRRDSTAIGAGSNPEHLSRSSTNP